MVARREDDAPTSYMYEYTVGSYLV
eukprot:SAG25_NODE_10733_length_324_cov_0.733333_2_plen_24_part_01